MADMTANTRSELELVKQKSLTAGQKVEIVWRDADGTILDQDAYTVPTGKNWSGFAILDGKESGV